MKYVCADIETTGLDKDICQVIEMACVIRDTDNMDEPLESSPAFHCYISHDVYQGQAYAIAMNARIFEQLGRAENRSTPNAPVYKDYEAVQALKEFLIENGYKPSKNTKRIHFVAAGKNFGNFDLQFLERMTTWKDHFNVSSRILDPAMLWLKPEDNRVPGLKTCMGRAGVEGEVTHHALQDVYDTITTLELGMKKLWGYSSDG